MERTPGAETIVLCQHFHYEATSELLWEVCNKKKKKLKPLNSVILRDSQTCPGGWKNKTQTSFSLILSLELESRFGLEKQVGTLDRKQREAGSLELHSAQHKGALFLVASKFNCNEDD